MSNFNLKAKNKQTGEIVDFHAMDNYFGHHRYGYEENNNTFYSNTLKNRVLKESEFDTLYEEVEDEKCHCSRTDRLNRIDSNYKNHTFDRCFTKDPNHPYGGMEVTELDVFDKLDSIMPITGNDTWEDRFNMKFVDEDTGLLNISKYDYEEIKTFIHTLLEKQREEYVEMIGDMKMKPHQRLGYTGETNIRQHCIDDIITLIKSHE